MRYAFLSIPVNESTSLNGEKKKKIYIYFALEVNAHQKVA